MIWITPHIKNAVTSHAVERIELEIQFRA